MWLCAEFMKFGNNFEFINIKSKILYPTFFRSNCRLQDFLLYQFIVHPGKQKVLLICGSTLRSKKQFPCFNSEILIIIRRPYRFAILKNEIGLTIGGER